MIYKISFFRFQITPADWLNFFDTVLSSATLIEMTVLRNGRKIDFFIASNKKLDALNARLSPFYLSDELSDSERQTVQYEPGSFGRFFPVFLNEPLLHSIEKFSIDKKELVRLSFRLWKYNPFHMIPLYNFWYTEQERLYKTKAHSLFHVNIFLSFDVSKTIQAEITKVKPVLASNSLTFKGYPEGILDLKEFYGTTKFSVRSYDFWRHSLVLGQSGSGKSVFLKLLIEDIYKNKPEEYSVILVDPHASLEKTIKVQGGVRSINFKTLGTNIFINTGQPLLSAELTIDLFSTIISVHENQDMERVLKYSLIALYTINKMTVVNLRTLLTDTVARKELLKELSDVNVLKFFETEFQELVTTKYQSAVLPIINLLSELDFINAIPEQVDLIQEMNANFLVSFPIKQTELGKNITKIVGGAMIQQIFTIMQAGLVKKKVILIIDEVSIVQSPSLIHILSEARKFGLTVILTQQYLMQVSADVLRSILANTVNYFCFKLSREDAEIAARNITCNIDEYFLEKKNDPRESLELSIKLMTDLNPREVIGRVLVSDTYSDAFKAKTVSVVL